MKYRAGLGYDGAKKSYHWGVWILAPLARGKKEAPPAMG